MFGKFRSELPEKLETPQEELIPETVIGENVEIKGSLSFPGLLRIDGAFEGELLSNQGKLIVGPTGSVKADIDLEEAFIAGKVIGNITVKTRLTLRGRAEITGDINAPLISVDEGVSIMGKVEVPFYSENSPAEHPNEF
jgi:cytoskeletal protein CcmA (bactofilin family)